MGFRGMNAGESVIRWSGRGFRGGNDRVVDCEDAWMIQLWSVGAGHAWVGILCAGSNAEVTGDD